MINDIDRQGNERNLASRQINHIRHHEASSSRTLMRNSVSKSVPVKKARIKSSNSFRYHTPVTIAPTRTAHVNVARLDRSSKVNQSSFISHFAKPDTRSFVAPAQPIKSVLNKPIPKEELSIDQLLHKAMESLDNKIETLEQPVKRWDRFARSLVANRFNGIALD